MLYWNGLNIEVLQISCSQPSPFLWILCAEGLFRSSWAPDSVVWGTYSLQLISSLENDHKWRYKWPWIITSRHNKESVFLDTFSSCQKAWQNPLWPISIPDSCKRVSALHHFNLCFAAVFRCVWCCCFSCPPYSELGDVCTKAGILYCVTILRKGSTCSIFATGQTSSPQRKRTKAAKGLVNVIICWSEDEWYESQLEATK